MKYIYIKEIDKYIDTYLTVPMYQYTIKIPKDFFRYTSKYT